MSKLNRIVAVAVALMAVAAAPALAQTAEEIAEKERKAKAYEEQKNNPKQPTQQQKLKAMPLRPGNSSEAAKKSVAPGADPAAPGEHHGHLARLEGEWIARSKLWLEPGRPPVEAAGEAVNTMILGGRFLKSEYHGQMLGQDFHGLGLDGYDNVKGVHIGQWMDTAGTMITHYEGACSDDGKVITAYTRFDDPLTGERRRMRGVTTMIDADTYSYESSNEVDGEFVKTMEVVFTRK